MPNPRQIFGIPITKGKLLSRGDHGVVVQFNLRQLHLRLLVRAQLYSADHQPLSEVVGPHRRVTDIFDFPRSESAPTFAFAQKEYSAIVFVKSPNFQFSDDTRVVFWFIRYAIPAKSENDYVDLPDEWMPLAIANVKKQILLKLGKPIPEELERTIREWGEKIRKEGNLQNYYTTHTFELSQEELAQVGQEDEERPVPTQQRPDYAPNRKYQDYHFDRFDDLYIQEKSQVLAYDRLVKEFPADLKPDGFENFVARFRRRRREQRKNRK